VIYYCGEGSATMWMKLWLAKRELRFALYLPDLRQNMGQNRIRDADVDSKYCRATFLKICVGMILCGSHDAAMTQKRYRGIHFDGVPGASEPNRKTGGRATFL
jgi:hypothetical protein